MDQESHDSVRKSNISDHNQRNEGSFWLFQTLHKHALFKKLLDILSELFYQDIIQDFDQFYSEEFSRIEEKRNYVKEIVRELHVRYVVVLRNVV